MKILLKIVSGPSAGSQHWLEPGAILGRRKGTLLIEDPRISSKHAEILNENNRIYIRDLGSTHGLWTPSGRVTQLMLEEGTQFKMGDSHFQVIRLERTEADETLSELLASLKSSEDPPQKAQPFPALLQLEFLQGPHTGEVWPLGYGPRVVGTHALDLMIHDPEALPECFRLESRKGQVVLTTPHEHFVRVNEVYTRESVLQPNDLVAFGETLIKIAAVPSGT